jgi:hypothetical protein
MFSYVLQSLSIRDFDNHATRIVGKYEVHMQHIGFIIFHFLALSHDGYKILSCFFRLLIRTIDAAAALLMCNLYRFHFSVLVLWTIQYVPGKPFLGMNAGMLLYFFESSD